MFRYSGTQKKDFTVETDFKNLSTQLEKLILQSDNIKLGLPTYKGYQIISKESKILAFLNKWPVFIVDIKLQKDNNHTEVMAFAKTHFQLELTSWIFIILVFIMLIAVLQSTFIVPDSVNRGTTILILFFFTIIAIFNTAQNYFNKQKGLETVDKLIEKIRQSTYDDL